MRSIRDLLARAGIVVTLVSLLATVLIAPSSASAHGNSNSPPDAKKLENQFADFFGGSSSGYIPSPFLTDANRESVNNLLKQQSKNTPLAVKITGPISNQTTNLIFNNSKYNVSYIFGDLESPTAPQQVKTLAQQVRYVNGNTHGNKTRSHNAFIGNFGFQKLSYDFTDPSSYNSNRGQHSFAGWDKNDYQFAKLNMSMPALYPGSGSFRSPAAGNSSAPNIRSANFILPALRVSQVQQNTDRKEQIVPYAARFNNWGNLALDTDRTAANKFRFIPGQAIPAAFGLPAMTANQTKNQMLSRRDFAAQIAHYRLRGADSFVLFEPGVVGYSQEDKRSDAKKGWTEPKLQSIFDDSHAKLLGDSDARYKSNLFKDVNYNINVDGKEQSQEQAGATFSGVYSLAMKRMGILISNMDDEDHTITLPSSVEGFSLKTKSFDLDGGSHLLIEYKLKTSGVNKGWSVMTKSFPFLQLPNTRSEVGIPEPANVTFLAMLAFLGVTPRRRRKA